MALILSLKNRTDYTPTVQQVALANCQWVNTQQIANGTAIGRTKPLVGMVTPLNSQNEYSVTLMVRYGWVAPGPGGTDITVQIRARAGQQPHSIQAQYNNQRVRVNWEQGQENNDWFVFLEFSQ